MKKNTLMLIAAVIGIILLVQFAGLGEMLNPEDEAHLTAQFTADPIVKDTVYLIHEHHIYNYSYWSYPALTFTDETGKSYHLALIKNPGTAWAERNDFGNYTVSSVYCAKDPSEPANTLHTLFKHTEDEPAPPPVTTASYTVTINDATTNSPVSGATVTLNSLTGTTASDGSYTFQDLELGKYIFTASADGYVSMTASKMIDMAVAYYDVYTMPLLVEGPGVIPPVEGGGGGDNYEPPVDGSGNDTGTTEVTDYTLVIGCAAVGGLFMLLATGVIANPVFPKKWAIIIGLGLLAIAFLLYSGVL